MSISSESFLFEGDSGQSVFQSAAIWQLPQNCRRELQTLRLLVPQRNLVGNLAVFFIKNERLKIAADFSIVCGNFFRRGILNCLRLADISGDEDEWSDESDISSDDKDDGGDSDSDSDASID